jgi:hypothetical protein
MTAIKSVSLSETLSHSSGCMSVRVHSILVSYSQRLIADDRTKVGSVSRPLGMRRNLPLAVALQKGLDDGSLQIAHCPKSSPYAKSPLRYGSTKVDYPRGRRDQNYEPSRIGARPNSPKSSSFVATTPAKRTIRTSHLRKAVPLPHKAEKTQPRQMMFPRNSVARCKPAALHRLGASSKARPTLHLPLRRSRVATPGNQCSAARSQAASPRTPSPDTSVRCRLRCARAGG